MRTFRPQVEALEDRCTPIVHSFAGNIVGQLHSPNAGGTPATDAIVNKSALGAAPVPVVASGGDSNGTPFDFAKPHAPGRDTVLANNPNAS